MKLKANLHLHTNEDPCDHYFVSYSAKQAIDRAAELGFEILALTLHGRYGHTPELSQYAQEKNILLIPGIEHFIEDKHVLILGCDKDIEAVESFADLRAYKIKHPEICIIAPHPYFPGSISLGKKLGENKDVFDAIEQSWFHNPLINRNKKAAQFAIQNNLPYLATSDTHFLKYLNNAYAIIEAPKKNIPSVLGAVKAGNFKNHTKSAKFFADIVWQVGVKTILPQPWNLYKKKKHWHKGVPTRNRT